LTSDEVSDILNKGRKSVSSRVTELRRAGCLIELPMSRKSKLGKRSPVYVIDKDATDADYQKFVKKKARSRKSGYSEKTWKRDLVEAARSYATGLGKASKIWEVIERYPGPKLPFAPQAGRRAINDKKRIKATEAHKSESLDEKLPDRGDRQD
jgi:hypothetical protein